MKAVIGLDKIEKIQIYVAKRQKTVAQIKTETKADYIINGGLFNMSYNNKPNLWLRVDNKTLSTDKYGYWCYGWNDNDIKIIHSNDINSVKNAICCTTMIKDGDKTKMTYDSAQGGVRGRTAIGLNEDSLILFCSKDGTAEAKSPEALQLYMYNLGCKSAIMFDSGGSSSCNFNGQTVTTSRKCHNYICVYLKKNTTPTSNESCPYTEPTTLVKSGTKGNSAKWVQWHLNKHGENIAVDGVFGKMSALALIMFQRDNGLTVDGVCGAQTRAKLKE